MKQLFIVLLSTALFTGCGKSKGGKALGQEVCDCSKKANGMDPADPKRAQAQTDCGTKQVEAWNKIKDKPEEADAFNKVLSVCASEQIKKSFGQ
jgi:hypothetical protein